MNKTIETTPSDITVEFGTLKVKLVHQIAGKAQPARIIISDGGKEIATYVVVQEYERIFKDEDAIVPVNRFHKVMPLKELKGELKIK